MAKTQEEYDKEAAMGCADPTRALLMTRPAFGGNIMATLMCPRTKPQMATVRPGVMKRIDKDETRKGELIKFDVDFTEADMNVEILEVVKSDKKSVDLTEAKLIVSGGRGIGGPQGFDMIRDVADALGAEVGSSRACETLAGSKKIVRLVRQVKQYVLTCTWHAVSPVLSST